jgi:hypothetical protein
LPGEVPYGVPKVQDIRVGMAVKYIHSETAVAGGLPRLCVRTFESLYSVFAKHYAPYWLFREGQKKAWKVSLT